MKRTYIGIIKKDEQSDIGIRFPDFPGCVSSGTTIPDLIMSATEALTLHVKGMLKDGESLPPASSAGDIVLSADKGEQMMFITAKWEGF